MKLFRHIFAFALSLVLCTAALAGPTTQPATLADQLAAAQAQVTQLQVQAQSTQAALEAALASVTAIQKRIAALIPSGDITERLEQAKDGETVACMPGGTFTLSRTVQVKASGVTLDLNGSTLACTPSPGASSSIVAYGGHFALANANVTKANVLLRVYGPACTFTGCTVDNCTSAILTGEVGTGLLVQRCAFGKHINSVPVYITTDSSTVDSCSFAGSAGEYCLRYDFDSNGRKPVGALISNCSFVNHNGPAKDAVGFRGIDSARMTGCSIDGWVRFGGNPGPGAPPVSSATTYNAACIVDHCSFTGIADGGAAIRIYQGATVSVSATTFDCTANTVCISTDTPGVLTASGNVQLHAAGVGIRPLIGSSSVGTRIETGTTSATQPSR